MNANFFDRQERIPWWNQNRLSEARVLVLGAGALGNEVVKNLSLLGVGTIWIADFDVVENSNLSRAVLFRKDDAAKNKAEVIATRALALNPNPNAVVRSLPVDIVWELGLGFYRHANIIIGCLDNIEARLSANLCSWKTEKAWIDGGLWEMSGSVTVYDSTNEKACYECGLAPDDYRHAKIRYSCTNSVVKSKVTHQFAPTNQTTAAIIGALQTQEALKALHSINTFAGKRLIFNGSPHFYTDNSFSPIVLNELQLNPKCLCHEESRYSEIFELNDIKSKSSTAQNLFSSLENISKSTILALHLNDTFVTKTECPICYRKKTINRPKFRIKDVDVVCQYCDITCPSCKFVSRGVPDCPNCGQADIYEPTIIGFNILSPSDSAQTEFLKYTLFDLGIPEWHIVRLDSNYENSKQVLFAELSGDLIT